MKFAPFFLAFCMIGTNVVLLVGWEQRNTEFRQSVHNEVAAFKDVEDVEKFTTRLEFSNRATEVDTRLAEILTKLNEIKGNLPK